MPFPKTIFQTWNTKNISDPILKQWSESWKKYNNQYEYVLWDDEDNRKFIEENFLDFLPIYDNYDVNIKRVDAVRYFYLYKYGGIYADIDFECLKSFDDIMDQDSVDIVLGSLDFPNVNEYHLHSIPNAIMISKKQSDFWEFVIAVLKNIGNVNDLPPEASTGPVLLKLCLIFYKTKLYDKDFIKKTYGKDIFENISCNHSSKICVLSPEVFYPINWNDKIPYKYQSNEETIKSFPNSYAATYWMHSW